MTVQILKEDAQIKSFDEFLKKYQFREISYEEFKMLTEKRRPLRKHEIFFPGRGQSVYSDACFRIHEHLV